MARREILDLAELFVPADQLGDRSRQVRWMHTRLKLRRSDRDIPCSHDNPELLWIDDSEVVGDLIAVSAPVPGHVVAQEPQHCDAEVLEAAVALVVGGVSVHQSP